MLVDADLANAPLQIEKKTPKEMLSITDEGLVRINSSSIDLILTCPRKAQLTLRDRLAKSESEATIYGTAIHKFLETWYSTPILERKLPTFGQWQKEFESLYAYTENPFPDEPAFVAAWDFVEKMDQIRSLPDSNKRSLTTGLWTLRHYLETYVEDPFVVLRDDAGAPIVEREFRLDVSDKVGMPVELFGTIDVVFENKSTGVVVPCDHKTSSVVGNNFFNRLKPNHQYTAYIIGANDALGVQTNSFLVNCLQVKPKPTTKRGQPPHFPRQATQRTAEDIEEFYSSLRMVVEQYLRWLEEDNFPLGSPNACTLYGGCGFLDLCSAPPSIRENIINAKYSQEQ